MAAAEEDAAAAPSSATGSGESPSTSTGEQPPKPQRQLSPYGTKQIYKQLELPNPMAIMQQDAMDNCAVKTVMSGVMGGMFGAAFGLFSASLDNAPGMVR